MLRRISVGIACLAAALLAGKAMACDLRLEPSTIFGPGCQVLVGYNNGMRVGPFHIFLPDGSVATAGSCEGYVKVLKVQGGTVWLAPFHSVPARTYALAADCRSSRLQ